MGVTTGPLIMGLADRGQGQKQAHWHIRPGLAISPAMAPASPPGLAFRKMHGAGNDFIILDSRGRGVEMTPGLARALGDRHRGVGFDQLAEITDAQNADITLDFWNSDGSTAGACGNATRCVADLVMTERGVKTLTIRTERGLLRALRHYDGAVWVNMGQPQTDWAEVPLAAAVNTLHLPLARDPVAVGMGNPHCVMFVNDLESLDLAELGHRYEHDPLYPDRTNVEFAAVIGENHLRMRVWERGAGVTLACGSGACATAVAANLRGLTGRQVALDMDGGTLHVDWREDGVWLTGPVAHVFDAVLPPEFLAAHR